MVESLSPFLSSSKIADQRVEVRVFFPLNLFNAFKTKAPIDSQIFWMKLVVNPSTPVQKSPSCPHLVPLSSPVGTSVLQWSSLVHQKSPI